jgi:hypothetical protein
MPHPIYCLSGFTRARCSIRGPAVISYSNSNRGAGLTAGKYMFCPAKICSLRYKADKLAAVYRVLWLRN